ncbi:MAG TPA: amino acid racemase [Methylomirabilota bacterium]|jgi:aspartate racemase|nr:amino acid racemase [Methylomirabilota bacterium]
MQRIGVLGGISPQATMDFEARLHRVCQQLVAPDWNRGYPRMVVWYHRQLPIRVDADGRPVVPRQIDPGLLEGAAWLGRAADFLVVPCNAAHVGVREIERAAGCPVLSMVDVTLDEVARRGWHTVGVLGFGGAPALYVDPLSQRGVRTRSIDTPAQARIDAAIRALMEGREDVAHQESALAAVDAVRAADVDGVILGCTELPLLLGAKADAGDLINPVALLAEAAVRRATAADRR